MASKTRGNLIHIARSAFLFQGHELSNPQVLASSPLMSSERVSQDFVRMTIDRFGRDPRLAVDDDASVQEIAEALQGVPQSSVPMTRRVMRARRRPERRVVLIPGLHGCSHVFTRLGSMLPDDREVVGWEHLGIEDLAPIPSSIDDIAETVSQGELERSPECPVDLVGYCIGGLIAHEVARRLLEAGVDVVRVVLIDSHPARAIRDSGLPIKLQVLGPIEIAKAKFQGRIEHRMVKIGVSQLKALLTHRDRRVDVDVSVVRTGGELAFGPLEPETWHDLARSVDFMRISDVGHVELFRGRHEHRLQPLLAG
ncbi:MAG: hypothetical protein CMJ67_01385 [Planctomycetaceae bacterium]|nr:hypothetical protein [Planctomycetaceae bacterium]